MSELSMYDIAFAFTKTDKTDAILLVEGKKMHVNKALLSYHSDYFNTLFNSEIEEESMEEIEIKDVDFKNFATLLSLMQDDPLDIYKLQIEHLLKLADRFLLKGPKRIVEQITYVTTAFTRFEKLQIADRCDSEFLMQRMLNHDYGTRETFKDFHASNWNTLSSAAKSKIADKFFPMYANKL